MPAKKSTQRPKAAASTMPVVPPDPGSKRGVSNWKEAATWLRARGIEDIECITPDLAGVPRGKMMPSSKFTSNTSLALPSALYRHTISGEYPDETEGFQFSIGQAF